MPPRLSQHGPSMQFRCLKFRMDEHELSLRSLLISASTFIGSFYTISSSYRTYLEYRTCSLFHISVRDTLLTKLLLSSTSHCFAWVAWTLLFIFLSVRSSLLISYIPRLRMSSIRLGMLAVPKWFCLISKSLYSTNHPAR
jgi:hypothetical protein